MASHGYSHELAYNHTYDNFLEDVRKSIGILEDITGERVLGYRAPSWSIVERNYHYLEALESLGLKYDASIFPTKNFMYGIPHSKREVHKPIVNGRELNIFEVPTSVIKYIKKGIGYSGGFYFRLFPEFFIKHLMKHANRCHSPSVLYIHPREIDNTEKRLILPPKENFIHYFNIKNTFNKLGRILKHFEFTSIKNYLEQ
jgi:polysaccharide deacetylase family protein (PEP-CTERM system associated)